MLQDAGSILVSIVPQEAAEAGGQWRVLGENIWRNSGTSKSNLQFGTYTIEFKEVSGWITPPNKSVTLSVVQSDPWINSDPYISTIQTYTITVTSGSNGWSALPALSKRRLAIPKYSLQPLSQTTRWINGRGMEVLFKPEGSLIH